MDMPFIEPSAVGREGKAEKKRETGGSGSGGAVPSARGGSFTELCVKRRACRPEVTPVAHTLRESGGSGGRVKNSLLLSSGWLGCGHTRVASWTEWGCAAAGA